ncbi:putative uncharacterized protein C16orf52-like A isoform X3 [Penaeus vannamei]|uniref:Uncharacterized protein n=1 Tax=Penaeus vannamei TaxID=6689 RepID=A0A423TA30_PENVA|nr:putative uncharacterized protein C16orf52-like A isoform X3 [Penaeus vannamei]
MDKLTIISGALFLAADIFAVVSLAMPDWIVSDIGGDTRLGLLWTCETLYNRSQVCYAPSLGGAWLVTLGCVLLGCVCVTATIVLLALSHCRISLYIMAYARWVGFTAMVLFCLAAVVFQWDFMLKRLVENHINSQTVSRLDIHTYFSC